MFRFIVKLSFLPYNGMKKGGGNIMNENNNIEKDNNKSCFIITPIGDQESKTFRKMTGVIGSVKPVLYQYGFSDVKAAHEICVSGSINNQVIGKIMNSDLVIANLTDTNPNVMYELCLRHVVAKPIIHICERGTVLPFDIKGDRTIFYTDDMFGVEELKEEIEKYLKEIDYSQEYRDNPVYNAQKLNYLLKDAKNEEPDINRELLRTILNEVTNNNQYTQAIATIPKTPTTDFTKKELFLSMLMVQSGVFFIIRTTQWSSLYSPIYEIMTRHDFSTKSSSDPIEIIFYNYNEKDVDIEKVSQDLCDTIDKYKGCYVSVRVVKTNINNFAFPNNTY